MAGNRQTDRQEVTKAEAWTEPYQKKGEERREGGREGGAVPFVVVDDAGFLAHPGGQLLLGEALAHPCLRQGHGEGAVDPGD